MSPSNLASVAVGRPVRGEFTYVVPEGLCGRLSPGQRILVPFGRSMSLGFFLGPATPPPEAESVKLKPIMKVLEDSPSLPPDLIALLRFAAEHYRYPLGEVIKSALPPGLTKAEMEKEAKPDVQEFAVALVTEAPAALRRAPAQSAALAYLLAVGGRAPLEEVAHAIPGARETLRKLVERGLVRIDEEVIAPGVKEGLGQGRPAQLTPEQDAAVKELHTAIDTGGFQPFLLHGVTGSGKTEVYLRAVERALAHGKGSLVLVPEIALTPQLVGRFRSRFGADVAVLHSGLKDRERLFHWQALRKGTVRIAVGVRSAVFAPVENLGLVVVDEEHDPSFKQEQAPILSAPLLDAMAETITKGQQVILFLNRRGHSTFLLCEVCGTSVK